MRGWLNNQDRLRQDFQGLGRNATLGEGRLIGSLENPVDARDAGGGHDILRKASLRLKETDGYFQDPRLTCTATSHYGLWLGWTTWWLWTGGATRNDRIGWALTEAQRNPLKDHVLIIRSSNTLKCEDIHGGDQILWGTCAKLCRVLKPNRLAVSTVMDNLSQRNWSYLDFSTPLNIFDEGNYWQLGYENWLAEPSR